MRQENKVVKNERDTEDDDEEDENDDDNDDDDDMILIAKWVGLDEQEALGKGHQAVAALWLAGRLESAIRELGWSCCFVTKCNSQYAWEESKGTKCHYFMLLMLLICIAEPP